MRASVPSLLETEPETEPETEVGPTPQQLDATKAGALVHLRERRLVERLKAEWPLRAGDPEPTTVPQQVYVIDVRRPSFLLQGGCLVQVKAEYPKETRVFWCLFFDGDPNVVVVPFLDRKRSIRDVIAEKRSLECIRIDSKTIRDYVVEVLNYALAYAGWGSVLLVKDLDQHSRTWGVLDWPTPLRDSEKEEVEACLRSIKAEEDTGYSLRVEACMVELDALVWREFRIFTKDSPSELDPGRKGEVSPAKRDPEVLLKGLPDNCHANPGASLGVPDVRFPPDPEGWEVVPPEDASFILSDLNRRIVPALDPTRLGRWSRQRLTFYDLDLLRIESANSDETRTAYILRKPGFLRKPGLALPLDSKSSPILQMNEIRSQSGDGLVIRTEEDAAAYAVFFGSHVWGPEGPFMVLKSQDDDAIGKFDWTDADFNPRYFDSKDRALAAITAPVPREVKPSGVEPAFAVDAWVLYGAGIYKVTFSVLAHGSIRMTYDEAMVSAPSLPIHRLNEILRERRSKSGDGQVIRTAADAASYVASFPRRVWGDDAPFMVLKSKDDAAIGQLDLTDAKCDRFDSIGAALAAIAAPAATEVEPFGVQRAFEVAAWVLYGETIFKATFKVLADGSIEMTDHDEMLSAGGKDNSYLPYRPLKTVIEPTEPLAAWELERAYGPPTVAENRVVTGQLTRETLPVRGFRRCRFRGRLDLRLLVSDRGLSFEECVFENGLDLSGARLKGTLSIINCLLVQGGHHPRIDTAQPFSFEGLSADSLQINGLWSTGSLNASRVRIDGAVHLFHVTTLGGIDLQQCVIEQSMVFQDVRAGTNVETSTSIELYGAVIKYNAVGFRDVALTGDLSANFLRVGTGFFLESDAPRGNTIHGSIDLGGANLPQLLLIRNTYVGKSIAAKAVATGDVDLSGVQCKGGITLEEAEIQRDLHIGKGGSGHRAAATHLAMTGLKCLGEADITGLVLANPAPTAESPNRTVIAVLATFAKKVIKKVIAMTGLKRQGVADITGVFRKFEAPTAESPNGTVIANLATFAKKLIVATLIRDEKTKQLVERSARIPGRLDLSGSTIGELAVSVSSFEGEVNPENLRAKGILLKQAQINKFSAIGNKSGYPRPIDLSFSEIKWWEFRGEGGNSESDAAADYLQLLKGDPHKQRHTFSSIEQNLFNRGLDEEADEVHKEMRNWLRTEGYEHALRDLLLEPLRWLLGNSPTVCLVMLIGALVGVAAANYNGFSTVTGIIGGTVTGIIGGLLYTGKFGRWLKNLGRLLRNCLRSVWDFFTRSTTNPLPLLGIVVIWTLFSAFGVFSHPENIGPSEAALIAHPEWRGMRVQPDAEWDWWSGAWIALRFHVPVAVLTARSAWAPANGRELTVSLPYLSWRTARLSPEDYANFVLALHCLFWPVILIIASRKLFMRLGK